MNIVKVKFLKDGQPSGKAYIYFSENPVAVDDKVQINSSSVGIVTEINVPKEEIEAFIDKVKIINGLYIETEEIPLEDITVEEASLEDVNIVAKYENGMITTNFSELKLTLSEKVAEYKKLVVTEENKPKRKKDVAALRRIDKEITSKVSVLKADYLREFEIVPKAATELKEITAEAITAIVNQIETLEDAQRESKKQDIRTTFDDIFANYPTLREEIGLVSVYDTRWENVATTPKSIRAEITAKLDAIRDNVALINSMVSDKTEEALKLFWGDLDITKAMGMITRYEAQKKEIADRMIEQQRKDKDAEEERQRLAREREVERIKENAIREARAEVIKEEQAKAEIKRIKEEAEQKAREEEEAKTRAKEQAEQQAMAIKKQSVASTNYIYGISATDEEFEQIEMYMNSLGVEFERIG